jgi:hypothetical protein
MRIFSCALLAAAAAGCHSSTGVPMSQPLAVHEWGTFTSMVSSLGQPLEGLHHEEEALPAFVHARSTVDLHNKGFGPVQPTGVTQKLETPVLYFYTPRALAVQVHVDFPLGVVSQWFPDATRFAPTPDVTTVAGGSIDWSATLTPGAGNFPAVAADNIWAPSRRVASTPVVSGAEAEQFIFYRGLGAFATPFTALANADGTVTIKNNSSDTIPTVFLLRLHSLGGFIQELGALGPGASIANIVPPVDGKEFNVDQYVADASTQVAAALAKTGLTDDEARAMVDTWSRSYFRTPGMRFLFVVPRAWTDRLLPMQISPAPSSLVRTLVGRVEILTPPDESQLLSTVQSAAAAGMATSDLLTQLGRFAEPKLRRAAQLVTDPALQSYVAGAIAQAQAAP